MSNSPWAEACTPWPMATTLAGLCASWRTVAVQMIVKAPGGVANAWDWSLPATEREALTAAMERGEITTTQARTMTGSMVLLAGRVPPKFQSRCRVEAAA